VSPAGILEVVMGAQISRRRSAWRRVSAKTWSRMFTSTCNHSSSPRRIFSTSQPARGPLAVVHFFMNSLNSRISSASVGDFLRDGDRFVRVALNSFLNARPLVVAEEICAASFSNFEFFRRPRQAH